MSPCERIEDAAEELAMQSVDRLPDWVRDHVGECRRCRRRLETARLARCLVAIAPEAAAPPAGFADRVVARLPGERPASRAAEEAWRPAWGLIPTFAAAAIGAIILYQASDVPGPAGFFTTEGLSVGEQFVLGGSSTPEPDLILAAILEGGAK
jgi:hypothetical protein